MASQAAVTVEALLGMKSSVGNTRLGLANSIQSGLPVSALDRLADEVAPGDARFKFRCRRAPFCAPRLEIRVRPQATLPDMPPERAAFPFR